MRGRERRAEALVGVVFLATAADMAVLLPRDVALDWALAAVLVATYAAVSRIEYDLGAGYTVPTQLVLVPMLLLLPAPLVPLLVALAFLLGKLPDYLTGRASWERVVLNLGDSWHAVGPALVLSLAGAGGPDWGDWPVYLLALAAQFGCDLAASAVREWAAGAGPLRRQL